MHITIDNMRRAGLDDETILKVVELAAAERKQQAAAANRARVARFKERHRADPQNKS